MTAGRLIEEEIRNRGPIPFARFMEIALYAPGCGYYAGSKNRIGRGGDYYTSVSVGAAFGQVLASQLHEMWKVMGCLRPFTIVEQGANDGRLLRDIAEHLPPELVEAAEFRIVEPIAELADAQRTTLNGARALFRWHEEAADLPLFEGVHFSNELVDAFPFHLLVSTGSGWVELFVESGAQGLRFVHGALTPEAAGSVLPSAPDGHMLEVRPAVVPWLAAISRRLQRGFLLVIDYGSTREDLHDGSRSRGTFACYRNHRRDENPLETPGEKDITAHVDFTSLEEAGRAAGFSAAGFTDQYRFLTGAAESLLRELDGNPDAPFLRQLKSLLHPGSMGTTFRALCMAKGVKCNLSGFRYGAPSAAAEHT